MSRLIPRWQRLRPSDLQPLPRPESMAAMISGARIRFAVLIALSITGVALSLPAQTPPASTPLIIDATAPTPPPAPANYTYAPADAISPNGHTLGLNAQYLTLDGKPMLPVMGEIHYSRVPEAEWETEILKMKSAGVQIISTYIIWIHHEEIEGQWDWSGQRDLRRFVQLCATHGMYVVPRIGPWSHAEVRNGGFPDWLLTKTTQLRSNDPTYLHYVDLYDQQIAAQLKGLMWSDGGPVIAIQLENEYRGSGPNRGSAHILKLKEVARNAGLRVPFYTVTGWDGAAIPAGAVLPVYGGYPDAPWDASIEKLPPSEVYAFRFGSRVTGDMGAIGDAPRGNAANFTTDTPFMTAEMGGGMQETYHRRPIVSADDIAAMMPVMLGSGVNLYGTYMFHGGENPDGKLTTLQESLATHYANDLPQKSYDFVAPIGEFGDERESLLKLKSWNYFLADFGSLLAPMQPRQPNIVPAGPRDLSVPRIAARTLGDSGFLFVNNHVRGYAMPARQNFQVTIKLPGDKSVTLPSQPITLPADAYFVWPFNMDLSGLHLRFATAQPLAILGTKAAPVYAFFSQPGIPAEFVVENTLGLSAALSQESTGGTEIRDGAQWFRGLHPERQRGDSIWFTLPNGHHVTILLLNANNAERAWKVIAGSTTALLTTPQQAYVDGPLVILQNLGTNTFLANVVPEDAARIVAADPKQTLGHSGADVTAAAPSSAPAVVPLTPDLIRTASPPAPLPDGFKPSSRPRVVAAAPTDADWSRAGVWSITLPKDIAATIEHTTTARVPHPYAQRTGGMNNAQLTTPPNTQYFLRIHYTGDVARLSAPESGTDHLLTDDFYSGRPWLVGLTRFAPQLAQSGGKLNLSIYPLRPTPPIFFEPGLAPKPDTPPASVTSVELVTQYTLRLKLVPANSK
jgi:beta-galactosidase